MEVPGEEGLLVLPGTRLRIIGLGPGAGFARNFEVFIALE